jgi:hypothetical protein
MNYRGGPIARGSGRRLAGAGVALAAVALTCAGCGHVLPLRPEPAAPRQLASAIVLQRVLGQPPSPAGHCPAGYATLAAPAADFPAVSDSCYRKVGQPVTFTSAGVNNAYQPAANQQPAEYGLAITLPAAEATELTAITTKAFRSRDAVAVSVAGKTWEVPFTEALTHGQFDITVQSENLDLQLQRTLLQHS